MKIPRFTGRRFDAAQFDARRQAAALARSQQGTAAGIPGQLDTIRLAIGLADVPQQPPAGGPK